FLLPFLAFTNLHVIHNYYAYGNGLFLLVASGWAIEGALEERIERRAIAYGLLVACLAISVFGYYRPGSPYASPSHPSGDFRRYHQAQIADARFAARLGTVVASATSPGSVVVGLGMDWSSELPFYADRRALMLPDWMPRDLHSPMLAGSLANLRPGEVGA